MDTIHDIDDYVEDWITFMYCYEAQKADPSLRESFYSGLDQTIIDLLKQYESGSIDQQQLCDRMVSHAKSKPPVK